MLTRHETTGLEPPGKYVPPHRRPPTGPSCEKRIQTNAVNTRACAAYGNTKNYVKARPTYDKVPPTCTPESLIKKVQEGYKKNPEKFKKLHLDLFPIFPKKAILELTRKQQLLTPPRPKYHGASPEVSVPIHILMTGDQRLIHLHSLTPEDRIKFLDFENQIANLREQYTRRVAKSKKIISKMCRTKMERWQARQSQSGSPSPSPSPTFTSTSSLSTQCNENDFIVSDEESVAHISDSLTEQHQVPSVTTNTTSTQTDTIEDPLVLSLQQQVQVLKEENAELERQIDYYIELADQQIDNTSSLRFQQQLQTLQETNEKLTKENEDLEKQIDFYVESADRQIGENAVMEPSKTSKKSKFSFFKRK